MSDNYETLRRWLAHTAAAFLPLWGVAGGVYVIALLVFAVLRPATDSTAGMFGFAGVMTAFYGALPSVGVALLGISGGWSYWRTALTSVAVVYGMALVIFRPLFV